MKKIAMFLFPLLAVMLMGCDEDLCMKVHHSDVIPGLYGGYIGCRYVLNDGSKVEYISEYYAVKCTDSYVIKDSTRVRDRWSSDGWRWLRWQGTYQTLEHCLDGVADYRQRVKEIEKKDEEAVKRYEEAAKKYEIVTIGKQVWMSKNLNVKTEGSWCYDNKPENCEKYGRLYTWAAAMKLPSSCNEERCQNLVEYPHQGICPSGFHIPSWTDFPRNDDSLLQELVAGMKLKSSSGWGGMARWKGFDFDYDFRGVGEVASFWTDDEDHSEDRSYEAEFMYLKKDYNTHYKDYKYNGFSVRCILD